MFVTDPFRKICWAPADDPGGAAAAAGDPPAGAGDPPPDQAPAAKWWEGEKLSDEQRSQITALGLTVEDPVEAVARLADMERSAKQKLGAGVDKFLQKPAEGQDVAEWLRQNGKMFGIPESAEGYEIGAPEGWPKDAPWDTEMEAAARELGHKHGISGAAMKDIVALYAGKVGALMGDADDKLAAANAEMQADLQRDWGAQYGAKVALAKQAVSVVGEKAGLDADGIAAIAGTLKPKIGDAGTVKLFAAIGEMMGEDALVSGGSDLGTTPADARARLVAMRAEGGEYYQAVAKNDKAALKRLTPEIQRLEKIAAGGA